MIKSSTRLGVGHFFFRNSGAGGCGLALQMFRVCVFPGASRPKMLQEFFQKFGKIRKNSRKCTRSHLHRASPGGPHLFWGLHDILFGIKGPHIIDSLKSKNLSNFFSPKCEKSENFQSWIWKFSTTSSDHHAAEFLKKSLWKFLKNSWKILENFKVCQKRLQKISTKSCKMLQTFCKSVELLYGKFRFVIEYWVPASKSKYWPILSQSRKGSFSAVSTPIFASKYSLESSRRDLHNALLCTVL